jgi:hypothetical protein
MRSTMDLHQLAGVEREWLVDATVAVSAGKNHSTRARVRKLLSDSKKNMKLMLIGRGGDKSNITPASENDNGNGARAFLEQVSHINDEENRDRDGDGTTITSIYTYNDHTAKSIENHQNHYPWERALKAFDVAQALPVVAAGRTTTTATTTTTTNDNDNNNDTSNENITAGAATEEQTTTIPRSPDNREIWRTKQQPRTTNVASVTLPDDMKKDNDMESILHCNYPCGSTSNNNISYTPPATCSSIGNNTIDNEFTTIYQQLEHMKRMQYAQEKIDMADICKDLMHHQEHLSKVISNDIIQTRYALGKGHCRCLNLFLKGRSTSHHSFLY